MSVEVLLAILSVHVRERERERGPRESTYCSRGSTSSAWLRMLLFLLCDLHQGVVFMLNSCFLSCHLHGGVALMTGNGCSFFRYHLHQGVVLVIAYRYGVFPCHVLRGVVLMIDALPFRALQRH